MLEWWVALLILGVARVVLPQQFYTSLGDAAARKNTARALERATGFVRRQIGQRLRLRRTPEIEFQFDESIGPGGKGPIMSSGLSAPSEP